MVRDFDYVVIGSGIAGLTFALKVAEKGSVAIVTKKNRAESNTNYAQGGIACVTSEEDTFDMHVRDTLDAGAGLCREDVVRRIIEEGPARIQELIALGMSFTERENGSYDGELDLTKEGGHSKRRVLHAADITGREVERALLAAIAAHPNIAVFEDHAAVNLVTLAKLGFSSSNRCVGVYVLNNETGAVETFRGRHFLLATGGCGKTYLYTTNPDIATGDGVAMAYRAGVDIANMEFIQFHPTCLYHPKLRSFLISEAVRGEGGVLVDRKGNAFMEKYDTRGSLAPRDIVARAIDAEMKRSAAPCVYLDITSKPADFIRDHFPNIYETCFRLGIDMTKEPIPVVPAAHYQCGGVVTDTEGRTTLAGLWAVGEVACTGLHGANRLASNSLLECLVFAQACARHIDQSPAETSQRDSTAVLPPWDESQVTDSDEEVVVSHNWDELRRFMWDYVGIVRTTKRLQRAAHRVALLQAEIDEYYGNFRVTNDLLELRNLTLVADLIIRSALDRTESRGLHYCRDHPSSDDAQRHPTLLTPQQSAAVAARFATV